MTKRYLVLKKIMHILELLSLPKSTWSPSCPKFTFLEGGVTLLAFFWLLLLIGLADQFIFLQNKRMRKRRRRIVTMGRLSEFWMMHERKNHPLFWHFSCSFLDWSCVSHQFIFLQNKRIRKRRRRIVTKGHLSEFWMMHE